MLQLKSLNIWVFKNSVHSSYKPKSYSYHNLTLCAVGIQHRLNPYKQIISVGILRQTRFNYDRRYLIKKKTDLNHRFKAPLKLFYVKMKRPRINCGNKL